MCPCPYYNFMQIRAFNPHTDVPTLLSLLRLNTPEFFAPEEEEDFINYLKYEATRYFVVEADDQLVGCGGYNNPDGPTIFRLSWDIVHPAWQGQGIGRRLSEYRIQQIREAEGGTVILVRTSQHVYRFYERLGFVLQAVVKDYWAAGYDLYQMEYAGPSGS